MNISQLWIILGAKIQLYCTSDIYKQTVLILSRLSDSKQGRRGSYFQAQAFISALEQARVLILSKYVLLRVINTIYKHCHA